MTRLFQSEVYHILTRIDTAQSLVDNDKTSVDVFLDNIHATHIARNKFFFESFSPRIDRVSTTDCYETRI